MTQHPETGDAARASRASARPRSSTPTLDAARRGRLRPADHGRRRRRAKASKATLYRRWNDKAEPRRRRAACAPRSAPQRRPRHRHACAATCSQTSCGDGGLTDRARRRTSSAGVITALHRDPEFAEAFRARVHRPEGRRSRRAIYERARDRGEITADVDLDLLAPALAGIVLHRAFVLGDARRRRDRRPRRRRDHPARRAPGRRARRRDTQTTHSNSKDTRMTDRPTATRDVRPRPAARPPPPGLGARAHLASRS